MGRERERAGVFVLPMTFVVFMAASAATVPEGYQTYDGLRHQFVVALPSGWDVFNQMETITGDPGSMGTVVFCSQQIDAKPITSGDEQGLQTLLRQLAGVELGNVPGIMLDRLPAKKGMSCKGFAPKAEQKIVNLMGTDPMFGPGRTTHEPPRGEPVAVGGCQGMRYRGKGETRDGDVKILDVFAVSDGSVLYLFKLLNLEKHYSNNVAMFEEVLSTLELTAGTGG